MELEEVAKNKENIGRSTKYLGFHENSSKLLKIQILKISAYGCF